MILSFNYNGCRIQLFKIFSDTLDSVVPMHSHAKTGTRFIILPEAKVYSKQKKTGMT